MLKAKVKSNVDNQAGTLNIEITSRKEWLSLFKWKIPQNKEKSC